MDGPGAAATSANGKHRAGICVGGQQRIDLQKAREAGAITDAEYRAQRAKFLRQK